MSEKTAPFDFHMLGRRHRRSLAGYTLLQSILLMAHSAATVSHSWKEHIFKIMDGVLIKEAALSQVVLSSLVELQSLGKWKVFYHEHVLKILERLWESGSESLAI